MEENLQDDRLDDYVRKSFEDYEEDPASDMWDRVEAEIPPPARLPVLRLFRQYGWQTLAASIILVLFSTLVCQHLYYRNKLQTLSQSLDNTQTTLALERPTMKAQAPIQPSIVAAPNEVPLKSSGSAKEHKPEHSNLGKEKAEPSPNQFQKTARYLNQTPGAIKQNAVEMVSRQQEAAVLINTTEPDLINSLAEGGLDIQGNSVQAVQLEPESPPLLEISCIPVQSQLIDVPVGRLPFLQVQTTAPLVQKYPIKPQKEPTGWYIGAQTSLAKSTEKNRPSSPRPGHALFPSNQQSAAVSKFTCGVLGKKLNAHFSIEGGVGYQEMTNTATHTPRFRFAEGILMGQMGSRRDFNYDLSAYGGTAEVSLRMEVTPGAPPADNDPVELKITTTERTAMLRIPLLLRYNFGKTRLQGNFKAGILGNAFLKNELDISASVSQNSRLQPVAGKDGYTIQLNQGKFFLGYWISAGAELKCTKHWSLVAEPSLIGDFARNDQNRRALPKRSQLGLNVGAKYYF